MLIYFDFFVSHSQLLVLSKYRVEMVSNAALCLVSLLDHFVSEGQQQQQLVGLLDEITTAIRLTPKDAFRERVDGFGNLLLHKAIFEGRQIMIHVRSLVNSLHAPSQSNTPSQNGKTARSRKSTYVLLYYSP